MGTPEIFILPGGLAGGFVTGLTGFGTGLTAFAFNFKQSFDACGQSYSIDRMKIKAVVEKNKAGHGISHEQ